MADVSDIKVQAKYLALSVASVLRGLNPITRYAGQPAMKLGGTDPHAGAMVEFYEPMTSARAIAIAGTPPTGKLKKTSGLVPMHHVDDAIQLDNQTVAQAMKTGDIPMVVRIMAANVFEKLQALMLPDIINSTFNYYGAVNAVPNDGTVITGGRAMIGDRAQGCYAPDDGSRVMLVDSTVYGSLLNTAAIVGFSNVGSAEALRTGQLIPMHGFGTIKESSYFSNVNHTVGTATGVKLNGEHAANAHVLSLVTAAGAGTVVKGAVFTIAGSAQKHRIVGKLSVASTGLIGEQSFADVTLVNGAAQDVNVYPPLPALLPNDAALTFLATHGIGGLAMHPMALVTASRRLPEQGAGYVESYVSDAELNLDIRVTNFGGYLQNNWACDINAGAVMAVPRYAGRIIRTPWA
jgi:hypothetical protein